MEEKIIENEIAINSEKVTKSRSRRLKNNLKEKKCEVIKYDKKNKILDIKFDSYGIRLKNVESFYNNNYIIIKYKGEIGKANFIVQL